MQAQGPEAAGSARADRCDTEPANTAPRVAGQGDQGVLHMNAQHKQQRADSHRPARPHRKPSTAHREAPFTEIFFTFDSPPPRSSTLNDPQNTQPTCTNASGNRSKPVLSVVASGLGGVRQVGPPVLAAYCSVRTAGRSVRGGKRACTEPGHSPAPAPAHRRP
jgi:hypothetical protein